jgi:hypothetical protein
VECLGYLDSKVTNIARCKCEAKANIVIAKPEFNKKKILFYKKMDLSLTKKPVICNIRSLVLYVT